MTAESSSDAGWPSGWLIAAAAGVAGAVLARWIGDTGMGTAVLGGIFVFLVFGVLMGMFWGAPPGFGHEADHRLRDHGHEDLHVPGLVAAAGPIAVMPAGPPQRDE